MKNFKTSNATLFAVVVLLNEPVMTSTEIQDTPETKGSSPNMTSKELQTDFSDSMDPFLSDETAPPDHDTELEVDGVGAGVEVEEGGNATGAVERASERKSATDKSSSSPTLPACRKTSQEATSEALPGTEEDEGGPVEADLSEWHPLNQSQSEAKDLNQTQDTTFVNDSLAHGSDEKHVPIPVPRSQTSNLNLQIVTKAPSPQPWDLVDPPPSNNGDATDFYSTLGTKNFATLQNKRYALTQSLVSDPTQCNFTRSNSRPAIPQSSYYFGPPSTDTAYGTNPVGHIGIHHPREVFRVERDYTGGELVQFAATYPLELEGRVRTISF